MAAEHYQLAPRGIRVFDLATAPSEMRMSAEATCLVGKSGGEAPLLQVWMTPKALALEPPLAAKEITEVTLWEHQLHRWLTQLGVAPGETAYVVWTQHELSALRNKPTQKRLTAVEVAPA